MPQTWSCGPYGGVTGFRAGSAEQCPRCQVHCGSEEAGVDGEPWKQVG